MGDLVNLNKARKTRAKDAARAAADANRAKYGRTKAERERDRADAGRLERIVEGAKLEKD